MYRIEIKIGKMEEKKRWKGEIESILKTLGIDNIKELKIKKIIITDKFDETVNRIGSTNNYKSKRYAGEAQATVISDTNGDNNIVVSSDFWTNFDNYEIKFLFLTHEIYHIINSLTLPQLIKYHSSKATYLAIVYELYNEYSAVRFSTSLLLKNQGIRDIVKILYEGYMKELQNPETFYLPMKKVIEDFRCFRMDINEYVVKIYKYINPILKYVANIFAYCHCYPEIKEVFNNSNNKIFITENLIKLFDIFNSWYKRKTSIIYEDCLVFIKNYLRTLGIKYHNVEEGIYITVLDI